MISEIINFFRRGWIVNYYGPYSALLLSLIFTPFLIIILGLEEWAPIGIVNLLTPSIYIILYGLNISASREFINILLKNNKSQAVVSFFWQSLVKITFRNLIFFIFILLLLIFYFSNIKDSNFFERYTIISILISFILVFKVYEVFFSACLNGLKDFFYLNTILSISSIIKWIIGFLITYYISNKVETFLFIFLITTIFTSVILNLRISFFIKKIKYLKNERDSIYTNELYKNIGIVTVLLTIYQQIDKLILVSGVSEKTIGYYSLAFMFAIAIPQIVNPMLGFFAPSLNQYVQTEKITQLNQLYKKIFFINFIILSFLSIFLFFFGDIILYLWLRNANISIEVFKFLKPLILVFFAFGFLIHAHNYLVAIKKIIFMKNAFLLNSLFTMIIGSIIIFNKNLMFFLYFFGLSFLFLAFIINFYVFNYIKSSN